MFAPVLGQGNWLKLFYKGLVQELYQKGIDYDDWMRSILVHVAPP